MRKLAVGCLAFGTGIFCAIYVLNEVWMLILAAVFGAVGIMATFVKSRRKLFIQIICFGLAIGFLWSWGYNMLYYRPAAEMDGHTITVTGVVTDYPEEWRYGYSFDAKLMIGTREIKALVYSYDDVAELVPGDELQFSAEISLTDMTGDEKSLSMISKGYLVYAFADSAITVTGHTNSWIYFPKTVARAVNWKLSELFSADTASFLKAILIGERSEFSENLSVTNAFSDAGIYHIVAVSGLHVSFFAGLIYAVLGNRKWTAIVIIPMVLFFMAITGFTPSVTRAGIMQIFTVTAPLVKRDNDSITALSFALAVILLINPYAAANAGLQLSFLATFGIIVFTPGVRNALIKATGISRKRDRALILCIRDRVLYFIIISFSTTFGALVLTMPLSALYFKSVSLAAPLANMLILWAASFVFSFGLIGCAAGFVWIPLAKVVALPVTLVVRYIILAAEIIGNSGFAAVYTSNKYIVIWLVYVYLTGMVFVIMKAGFRKLVLPICMSVIALCTAILVAAWNTDNTSATFTALDVGQGQSIVLTSGEFTAAVDCGSNYCDAGNILADYVLSLGRSRLDAFVLTHYDSDHCSGIDELLERIDIEVMIIPVPETCDGDNAEEIIALAERENIEIIYADEDVKCNFGDSTLRVYAPLTDGDENEMCLVSLFSCGSFDVLVTGDIGISTERILVHEKELPDIEVLVAGHHGSRNSTGEEILNAAKPETVVISVGSNSYGHPSDEVMERATDAGAEIYRTDKMGNVTITYNGE